MVFSSCFANQHKKCPGVLSLAGNAKCTCECHGKNEPSFPLKVGQTVVVTAPCVGVIIKINEPDWFFKKPSVEVQYTDGTTGYAEYEWLTLVEDVK